MSCNIIQDASNAENWQSRVQGESEVHARRGNFSATLYKYLSCQLQVFVVEKLKLYGKKKTEIQKRDLQSTFPYQCKAFVVF
jgi:hypothetical protein